MTAGVMFAFHTMTDTCQYLVLNYDFAIKYLALKTICITELASQITPYKFTADSSKMCITYEHMLNNRIMHQSLKGSIICIMLCLSSPRLSLSTTLCQDSGRNLCHCANIAIDMDISWFSMLDTWSSHQSWQQMQAWYCGGLLPLPSPNTRQ